MKLIERSIKDKAIQQNNNDQLLLVSKRKKTRQKIIAHFALT